MTTLSHTTKLSTPTPTYALTENLEVDHARQWQSLFRMLMLVGAVTLAAGAVLGGTRFWTGLLLASVFLVGLGLAGGMLIAFEYLTGASWSVACRRVPEAMTRWLPWGGLGVLLVMVLHPALYPWTADQEMIGFRAFWLQRGFFLGRTVVYLAIWILFTRAMVHNSRQQDHTGDIAYRRRNVVLSAVFTVLFGLTVWLASVDWLMSLEPHWVSTIYGFYFFSGLMSSGVAVAILLGLWLRRLGPLRGIFSEEHLQDLGKLLLTFTTFWAYIWFSQYMLIWYANIPEETVHYLCRVQGAWGSLMIVNILLNWAIPFFALLSRKTKRDGRTMVKISMVVLLGHWLDLYLMIVPSQADASVVPSIWMLGLTLGFVGMAGTIFWRAMKQAPVVPVRDPLLDESLHYHQ